MTRVKTGTVSRRRHKKTLKLTKGQYGSKHRLFRRANEGLMKSLKYAYRDRRNRRRELRRLWIARINAAARQNGLSYSHFMHGLKKADVELDRKLLAELAATDGKAFAQLAELAKSALAQA